MAKSILVISDQGETDHCSLRKARDIAAPLGDEIIVAGAPERAILKLASKLKDSWLLWDA